MEQKSVMRSAISERLQRMNARDRENESRTLVKELRRYIKSEPMSIAAYMPLSDEPDIAQLLKDLHAEGWTIYLPRMENVMALRKVSDFSKLERGKIGPLEPTDKDEVAKPEDIDLAIVPGRAFTSDGRRLGRGNGGYDHWIARQRKENPQTRYIGICFECQIVPDLPMETHDERMDAVITSRGPLAVA